MSDQTTLSIPASIPDDPMAAALLYAKHGWYVLPVKAGTKNPGSVVGKAWQRLSTRNPQQIAAYWSGTNHGIALHVGRSGAVVFDVDTPSAVPEPLQHELTLCPFQSTNVLDEKRGHHVFLAPPGRQLGNSLGALDKGWGDVRGSNGVIVVAPSAHPNLNNGGHYEWRYSGRVPPLPEWIADSLPDAGDTAGSATDAAVSEFLGRHADSRDPRMIKGWVVGFERDVAAGASRHTTMATRLAGAMKEAAAGYFPAEQVHEALWQAFYVAVTAEPISDQQGARRTDRQAREEFDGLLSWAVGQAMAADPAETAARVEDKTTAMVSDDELFDLDNLSQGPPPKDEPGGAEQSFVSGGLYLTRSELDSLPNGEPLIHGAVDRHTVGVVSGRDQTYKSFFLLDMMLCMATGLAWHGHAAERTKVLLVVGEGAYGLGKRVAAWESHHGVRVEDEWFHVRRLPVNLYKHRDSKMFGGLLERVKDEGYGFVAFDTLQRNSAGADANSAKDAGEIAEALSQVRGATHRGSVFFVAHSGKDDRDVRGSSAFEDDADMVWRAKYDEDGVNVRFRMTKRKDGPDGLTLTLYPHLMDVGSLVLTHERSLVAMKPNPPEGTTAFLKMLGTPVFAQGGTATQVGEAASIPLGGARTRVANWLLDEGLIEVGRLAGRSIYYQLTSTGIDQNARLS